MKTDRKWEHFPHVADVGIRGFRGNIAEAFEQAAQALAAVVTRAEIRPVITVRVQCEAPDVELLFVEWLNAIIYEMATKGMLFGQFEVTRTWEPWYSPPNRPGLRGGSRGCGHSSA